jgi:glycosyltransferase involved in cell wall biosynthesis
MISVIIATRDRAALLAATLDALAAQEAPGCAFEVLVVDNASIDETPAVVETAARRGVPITYLYEARPGKSHALNAAVARARGDLLVFTDDDVLPSPGWLAAYARAMRETGADYAAGRILPLWEAPPPRWMSPELYGVLAIPDGGEERLRIAKGVNDHVMPLGANMAVSRRVLDAIGGWNPDLGKLQGTLRTGEDHELSLRMIAAGFIGVYEPAAAVRHRVPRERLRLSYFQRWFYDNGAIEAGLEQNYPTTGQYLLNVPRYLWRRFLGDLVTTIAAIVTWRPKRATAGEMRIAWFAGYVRARWRRHTAAARPRPAAIPGS